ncbi:hypothetical protein GYMLUDRAFT_1026023 [Collybiopsis luxurians FD-317 M1]|nr:hypothetical protein GYMLUDRAFT_1026023 [Collybiopsis luxurians FD-317 M1]
MKGKSIQSAQIFMNKDVKQDLLWFTDHIEKSSGMFFFVNIDWNPFLEADMTIYGDACLKGTGFWVPSLKLGFSGQTNPDSPMAKLIFYWEALTVLSALIWLTSQNSCRGSECKPF